MKKILLVILTSAISCSPAPQKFLDQAVEKYNAGKTEARQDIETGLLNVASKNNFDLSESEFSSTAAFVKTSSGIKILFPEKFNIDIANTDKIENLQIDFNSSSVAVNADGTVKVFNKNGGLINEISAEKENKKFEAVKYYSDSLILYSAGKLYKYFIENNRLELLMDADFPPPHKDYYRIDFKLSRDMLAVSAGIGAVYNLSIVDLKENKIIIKNIPSSSSKFYLDDSVLHYIDGGAGQWKLMELNISDKKTKELTLFTDLVDIELFRNCAIVETKNSINIFDHTSGAFVIPFNYELMGSSAGHIIIGYQDRMHAVDPDRFKSAITSLKNTSPGLFQK